MEIVHPTISISGRSDSEQIKLLTKTYPNITRNAESDCRRVIAHYDLVVKGKFWKKVAATEEEYFQKYYNKSKSWFEDIKEKLLLMRESTNPTLGEVANPVGRPEGSTTGHSPETLHKAKEVAALRALDLIQKQVADRLEISQQRVSELERINNNTGFNRDNIPLKTSKTPPPINHRGTSKAHAIARLKRDGHIDLAQQVESGQMTAAAARREAGYVIRERSSFSVSDGTKAESLAKSMTERLPLEFINDLYSELGKLIQEHHNEHNWIP